MFRENTEPKTVTNINCLICDGGMGDLLAYLVPVNYILKKVLWVKPLIWVPDYLLDFAKHVLPEHAIIRDFSKAEKKYNQDMLGISTRWSSSHTCMKTHPVDYAYHMLLDMSIISPEDRNYLKIRPEEIDVSRFTLPDKYVIISVASTAKVKELPAKVVNEIVLYVKDKGYTPVFLGKKVAGSDTKNREQDTKISDEIDFSIGVNLVDQTNVLEAGAIIAKAKAFIGMEGGLSHLAGFTDTPIVCSYSFINPEIMQPIREGKLGHNCYPVVPEKDLACRFCQSNMPLMYDHDFRECYYGPKDYTCVKQLTAEKFKEQLEKVL